MPDSHVTRFEETNAAAGDRFARPGANLIECDAAIVGAGMAGLCAATDLCDHEVEVLVPAAS